MLKLIIYDAFGQPRPSFEDMLSTVRSIIVALETDVKYSIVPDLGAISPIIPSTDVTRVENSGLDAASIVVVNYPRKWGAGDFLPK